tara:strand:+ start:315 stop:506 length:192 start_codon:yes stop_codon:yes gene_type:complete
MSSLRHKDTREEPMNPSNDVDTTLKGFFPDAATVVNVDKMHLYKGVLPAGGADKIVSSSFGPY